MHIHKLGKVPSLISCFWQCPNIFTNRCPSLPCLILCLFLGSGLIYVYTLMTLYYKHEQKHLLTIIHHKKQKQHHIHYHQTHQQNHDKPITPSSQTIIKVMKPIKKTSTICQDADFFILQRVTCQDGFRALPTSPPTASRNFHHCDLGQRLAVWEHGRNVAKCGRCEVKT